MDFSSETTRKTYSDRQADESWLAWCEANLQPQKKDVADVGCGGGIYSFAFAILGANAVFGIDSSSQYVDEAERQKGPGQRVFFRQGTAVQTGLAQDSTDIVFERALIHHLSDDEKALNLQEAYRILRVSGAVCVQDRTFEDIQSKSPQHWIRATLFEAFPKLVSWEKKRRPRRERYLEMMARAGFIDVAAVQLDEVRRTYATYDELESEIMSRKGKSILFELSDQELRYYCSKLKVRAEVERLVEVDCWTIWTGRKPAAQLPQTASSSLRTE